MGVVRFLGGLFYLAGIFLILDFFFLHYINFNVPFVGQLVLGLISVFFGYFFFNFLGKKGPAPLRPRY